MGGLGEMSGGYNHKNNSLNRIELSEHQIE
jgi:hypothetical protein